MVEFLAKAVFGVDGAGFVVVMIADEVVDAGAEIEMAGAIAQELRRAQLQRLALRRLGGCRCHVQAAECQRDDHQGGAPMMRGWQRQNASVTRARPDAGFPTRIPLSWDRRGEPVTVYSVKPPPMTAQRALQQ